MNFKTWTSKDAASMISYCLQNKPGQHGFERAEIVLSNYCYGDRKQMIEAFSELMARNPRISKPAWQIVLSFNEKQKLEKEKLSAIIQECARVLGFENHQYLAVEHTDTRYQHVHIIVNRVGFDGTAINDYNNIPRVLNFCREAEKKFELKKQLSVDKPKVSNPLPPISNTRHMRLLEKVIAALMEAENFSELIERLMTVSVKVHRSEGISFRDDKNVLIKGCQIGMPMKTVEHYLKMDWYSKTIHLKIRYEMRYKDEGLLKPNISRHELKMNQSQSHGMRLRL